MSPNEREAWWSKLIDAEDWDDRNVAAEALLDRVEQLEREVATAREAEHVDEGFKLALSRAYSRVEDLQAELAAARAAPPRPAAIVVRPADHVHGPLTLDAFESDENALQFLRKGGGVAFWIWHPATSVKEVADG